MNQDTEQRIISLLNVIAGNVSYMTIYLENIEKHLKTLKATNNITIYKDVYENVANISPGGTE